NSFPSYFLFIEIDPKEIDINIHPTKTEIKFQDEKSIYAILKSAVKQAVGKFSIDSIDFDTEKILDIPPLKKGETVKPPSIKIDPNYNPFKKKSNGSVMPSSVLISKSNKENWEKLYSRHADNQLEIPQAEQQEKSQQLINPDWEKTFHDSPQKMFMQFRASFIITLVKTGLLIVDQQNAHERILFEHYMDQLNKRNAQPKQQQMFPEVFEFTASDAELIKEISGDIKAIGFDIDEFGPSSFVINGIPADMPDCNPKQILENLLEQFKNSGNVSSDERNILIAKSLARSMSVKHGKILQTEEIQDLIDQLFACSSPDKSPDGRPTFDIISLAEIEKKFR
ncbi:MAG: DNA mismatch repair protein MutL, partial [Bacteroidota bacterium]